MDFRITGLSPQLFRPLYGLSDNELDERGVERVRVTQPHAAPCRIGLDDIAPGGWALLLNYEHQPATRPTAAGTPSSWRKAPRRSSIVSEKFHRRWAVAPCR